MSKNQIHYLRNSDSSPSDQYVKYWDHLQSNVTRSLPIIELKFSFINYIIKIKYKSDILMTVFSATLIFPILICQFLNIPYRPLFKPKNTIIKFKEFNKFLCFWAVHCILGSNALGYIFKRRFNLLLSVFRIKFFYKAMLIDILMSIWHSKSACSWR